MKVIVSSQDRLGVWPHANVAFEPEPGREEVDVEVLVDELRSALRGRASVEFSTDIQAIHVRSNERLDKQDAHGREFMKRLVGRMMDLGYELSAG